MRKSVLFAIILLSFAACKSEPEAKVMARYVPERADDFVFENNLIAGRFYGEALEGNPTSPGIDVWVKKPGKLVADEWYKGAMKDPDYYHHDHGGKDCYKVAVSLGGGASAPLIDGNLCYPATNYRSFDMVEESPEKVVFILHYPQWQATPEIAVSLDKKVTVLSDSYFCLVEDIYSFTGADTLTIAAGVNRHPAQNTLDQEYLDPQVYALWEHASDQSIEPEDGMLGVAVIVPGGEECYVTPDEVHGICTRRIRSGEPFNYMFGSCWSKGEVTDALDWFQVAINQI
ncbi:MAG: DUF4861 domain-containing protein [Bacteroidales bacterium]|nr:DUF4861 domain-containing protein [Bacteroidales bacterium]